MPPFLSSICFIGLACFALPACAQQPLGDDAPQAQFLDQRLQLHEHHGQCRLISDSGELDLQLKWPCRFHFDAHGTLRTRRTGGSHVLLVESSEPARAPGRDCHTTLQAVRSGSGVHGLEASPVVSRVATCPPFEWDEKVFIGLFEERDGGN